jgi:quercetin dioxygenase-like cupin family protein
MAGFEVGSRTEKLMFYALDEIAPQDVFDGYRARIYHGEQITFAVLEVQPHAALPEHGHHNEQVGLLVRGTLTFTVDGVERTTHAGEGWVIPAHVPHAAVAGRNGATVIETWAPPRTDFRSLPELPRSKRLWPQD